jgi:TolA-binding protein
MTSLEKKLEKLESDVKKLIVNYNKLKEENINLKQELNNLRLENKITEEEVEKRGGDNIRDVKNQLNKNIKSELESYVLEIDECIKMLKAEQ